jgi:cardiolipin synthase A/B
MLDPAIGPGSAVNAARIARGPPSAAGSIVATVPGHWCQRLSLLLLGVGLALLIPVSGGAVARTASTKTPLTLITEPDQTYAPIYKLLASPKHSLDLTMYELRDPKAEQILAADAKRGVKVRVLLDKDFVGKSENSAVFHYLASHHVKVRWASRQVEITHQKSFVLDGHKAVIMTGNLTSQYYPTTRDFALVDEQAKDVAAIEKTFNLDWADHAGTAPNGADLIWSPGSEARLVSLIGTARHSLLVENEEMDAPRSPAHSRPPRSAASTSPSS